MMNIPPEKLDMLLKTAGKKLGKDPQMLKNQLQSGMFGYIGEFHRCRVAGLRDDFTVAESETLYQLFDGRTAEFYFQLFDILRVVGFAFVDAFDIIVVRNECDEFRDS